MQKFSLLLKVEISPYYPTKGCHLFEDFKQNMDKMRLNVSQTKRRTVSAYVYKFIKLK